MTSLNANDEAAFTARLREFGLDRSQAHALLPPEGHEGRFVMSGDPQASHVTPHQFAVRDVDHAKQLAGNADEAFESGAMQEHHVIPRPWAMADSDAPGPDGLAERLSPEQRAQLRAAHVAYVYGYSPRVESYREVINAVHYPMMAGVVAAERLIVTEPMTLANHAYILGTVDIYANGSIEFADPAGTFQVTGTMTKHTTAGPS